MLLDLKRYLKANRRASLAQLCGDFEVEPSAMRAMLGHWLRKRCVRCFKPATGAAAPSSCQTSSQPHKKACSSSEPTSAGCSSCPLQAGPLSEQAPETSEIYLWTAQ